MAAESPPFDGVRLALVGATSLLGKELKDQLAASGVPPDAVTLFDLEEIAGILTDYGDEARVFAKTVAEDVLTHELICFCGDPATARDSLEGIRRAGALGIDCTGAWLDDPNAFAWIPGVSEAPSGSHDHAIVIPPAPCLMLGTTLAALGDSGDSAAVTVFVPASDLDKAGLQELAQQSTAVLNLEEVDVEVFGRQLAFDIWPAAPDRTGDALALASLLTRLGFTAPALQLVSVPVFHGTTMSLFVPGADAEKISTALLDAGITVGAKDGKPIDSPMLVTGSPGLHAIAVRPDRDGIWLWLTIDNLHARAAAAVAAIHALSGSGLSPDTSTGDEASGGEGV